MLDASIIICSRNRAVALRQTLDSLAAMDTPPNARFEVIVVDNGSTDDTKAVVEAAARVMPIRYVRENRPGLARARNAGIAAAQGRALLMTDDDCLVSSDWLQIGLDLLVRDPHRVIGGRVNLHSPLDLPVTIKTDACSAKLTSSSDILGFLHGCNMILGMSVIDQIGQFDPLLGAGTRCKAAEDTDLVYRALQAGIPVTYRPELVVSHNHGRRDANAKRQLEWGYTASIGAMAFKHLMAGRLDLIKLIYWNVRSDIRNGRPNRLPTYMAGAVSFFRSMCSRRDLA